MLRIEVTYPGKAFQKRRYLNRILRLNLEKPNPNGWLKYAGYKVQNYKNVESSDMSKEQRKALHIKSTVSMRSNSKT